MKILITGGTGYIGSHTCIELLNNDYEIVVADNLYNSERSILKKITGISGKNITFYQTDVLDRTSLIDIFNENSIDAVIHFAGYKSVSESFEKPAEYYLNNVFGTLTLLSVMKEVGVRKIVFSSSASVYGQNNTAPISETCPKFPLSPYATSKSMVEDIIHDICSADAAWDASILRCFNPAGAHESGLIGESPAGKPGNLIPCLLKVAAGEFPFLKVFGDDYDTVDGTGVRDYIHVSDLAKGHLKALERLFDKSGFEVFNLGTGNGYSVLEIINIFKKNTGIEIPFKIFERRPGDIASCWADIDKSSRILGWKAEKSIDDICSSGWKYVKNNL